MTDYIRIKVPVELAKEAQKAYPHKHSMTTAVLAAIDNGIAQQGAEKDGQSK